MMESDLPTVLGLALMALAVYGRYAVFYLRRQGAGAER